MIVARQDVRSLGGNDDRSGDPAEVVQRRLNLLTAVGTVVSARVDDLAAESRTLAVDDERLEFEAIAVLVESREDPIELLEVGSVFSRFAVVEQLESVITGVGGNRDPFRIEPHGYVAGQLLPLNRLIVG